MIQERERGHVKYFNEHKGFGFIERLEAPDVFVHYSALEGDGFKTLKVGDEVFFDVTDGEKGPQAVKVVRAAAK